MSWLIDNANTWFVLFGMIGIGFGAAWWLQRRPKLLLGVVAAVALIAVLWLLTRLVVTDRRQLELNVHALADAVVGGKSDVLLKHFADDFDFQGRKGKELADGVVRRAKQHKVSAIVISGFDVEDLQDRSAKVFFRATVHHGADDRSYLLGCRARFVKENDRWGLKSVDFYNPVVNDKIHVPIP